MLLTNNNNKEIQNNAPAPTSLAPSPAGHGRPPCPPPPPHAAPPAAPTRRAPCRAAGMPCRAAALWRPLRIHKHYVFIHYVLHVQINLENYNISMLN